MSEEGFAEKLVKGKPIKATEKDYKKILKEEGIDLVFEEK